MAIRNEAGFSIISVVIAILLLSVGILALSRTGAEITRAHTSTAARSTALAIARGYLEEIRSRDPLTLASEPAVKVDGSGQVSANGAYTRSVDVLDKAYNLKQLTVVVDYPNARVPIELVTLTFVGQAQLQ